MIKQNIILPIDDDNMVLRDNEDIFSIKMKMIKTTYNTFLKQYY